MASVPRLQQRNLSFADCRNGTRTQLRAGEEAVQFENDLLIALGERGVDFLKVIVSVRLFACVAPAERAVAAAAARMRSLIVGIEV